MLHRLFALLALCALALPVHATTLRYKSFDDLMREADGVVAGTVRSVESRYGQDQNIYTFVTLDRLEVVHGAYSSQTLTLRILGGRVGPVMQQVHGTPQFTPNERVLLFVRGNGQNMVPLVGWTQGMFRIAPDPRTRSQVMMDHDGNRVLGIEKGHFRKETKYKSEAHVRHRGDPLHSHSLSTDGQSPSSPVTYQSFVQTLRQHPHAAKKQFLPLRNLTPGNLTPAVDKEKNGLHGSKK